MTNNNDDYLNGLPPERLRYIRCNSDKKGCIAQLLGHIDKQEEEIKQLNLEIDRFKRQIRKKYIKVDK